MNTVLQLSLLILWFRNSNSKEYEDRPKISTSSGDLVIEAAYGRNIYLRTNGPHSTVYVAGINVRSLNLTRPGDVDDVRTFGRFSQRAILRRLDRLERADRGRNNRSIVALSRRINSVSNQLSTLRVMYRNLGADSCKTRPCANGGTCLALVTGYHCLCPARWEGTDCDVDVDECRNFAGTDLGCQNGATCVNRRGSYECLCRPGWFGLHCAARASDCTSGSEEMCGHGTCVPTSGVTGIVCICRPGWTTNSTGPACNTDIDECAAPGARCSINPRVECFNTPGSYKCGACPVGYEGDGHACYDIDECETANGGCSTEPAVSCHNVVGSRICGPCPPGYVGDGMACTWRGSCSVNRGGCHPDAVCVEVAGGALCICPAGRAGDGVGQAGCYVTATGPSARCEESPCGEHGRCHPLPRGFSCLCDEGYEGPRCEKIRNACESNPCLYGGTCRINSRNSPGYRCECVAGRDGERCEHPAQTCGGVLDAHEGSIVYPFTNASSYGNNVRCAWIIHTSPDRVINVTFTKFDIEHVPDCSYDFLQIHDGRSSASQLIGRFCGTEFPKGGNIISSHNDLYFWFRSDRTVSRDGFALRWTSITPVCGGDVSAVGHGGVQSPGWPGRYPPNRDCYWKLTAAPGKRIQLHFFQLDIEAHSNCSFDYLALYDGGSAAYPLLNKYCDSIRPAPVQSSGSEMLIHFHSDAYDSGGGFQISYAPVDGVPGCGGLFAAPKGEITSPSYDGRYLSDLACDYEIRAPPDFKIQLDFVLFKIERSFRCRYDHLIIHDGALASDAKLVGKFCGEEFPKTYTSVSNVIRMRFRTDGTIASDGFKILYKTVCHQTIEGDSGVLRSPNYPEQYPANTICEYIIAAPLGKAIQLSFQDFDVEDNNYYDCQYDHVEIKDGPDDNSTSLGRYCGSTTHTPPVLTSTHNFMFIKFISDLSVHGTGFYANFTTIDIACGGIYTNIIGLINYPPSSSDEYEEGLSCTWMLIAPFGYHIKLTWNRFEIEDMSSCSADYVNIIEIDENNNRTVLGKYCGSTAPPALTTSTNRLEIHFETDYSIQGMGFSLSYAFLDLKTHCGGTFVKPNGHIYSPGWPQRYYPNRDCEWIIVAPLGQQISLKIITFDIERPVGGRCNYGDYLELRNGAISNSGLIGKYCGTDIPKRITSLGNALYIRFYSDFYLGGQGFDIEWDSTVTGCGGTLTGAKGSISSPNYPNTYHDDAECFYKIVTSAGSRIRITFTTLDLEVTQNCKDDYIEIYDGRDSQSKSLGKYCSMPENNLEIKTTTNLAFIKFRSDILNGGKGFLLTYSSLCKNNITGSYGTIESPQNVNDALFYDCAWTITVPKGNTIKVIFTHFKVLAIQHFIRKSILNRRECTYNYLQIRDGLNSGYNSKLCGNILPYTYTSKNNVLEIKLHIASTYPSRPYIRLEWVKEGCGGPLVKDFGIISLPRSTLPTKDSFECEWQIETRPGYSIKLTLSTMYMMESINCTVDSLEIYDGQNIHTPLLSKICRREMTIYQSNSNFMLIRLIKQSDYRDVTFSAIFESTRSTCGGLINSLSGFVYSPNYPKNYDNNIDCTWFLHGPINHVIEFNILDLDLYSPRNLELSEEIDSKTECGDSIKLYDSAHIYGSNYSHIICPFSHTKQIISKSNNLNVQFTSDAWGSAKGFKASFHVTCGAQIQVTNDGILTNDRLSTLNTNRSCVWTLFSAKTEQKISFTLSHMSIPKNFSVITNRHCPSSYLRIYDGNDIEAPLIKELCGRKITPMIVSKGNILTVELGSYTGYLEGTFTAHYTVIDTFCGGTLTSEEGSLASPNYPNTYPIASSCEWILSTAPGNKVFLTFENFDIEYSENCNEDYVELRENNGGGKLIGVYCGSEIPINTTVSSKIFIKFHSDEKGNGRGFLAHYGFVHGSEIEDLDNGEIASPLFPHLYEGPGEYTWHITARGVTSIIISLLRLEIAGKGSDCHNSLTIYDGYDETSPVLKEFCGLLDSTDKVLRTTTSVVFLKLKLDETNTGSIFDLLWSTDLTHDTTLKYNCGSNGTITYVSENIPVVLKMPTHGDTYENSMNCEWLYKTNPGSHLKIAFESFELKESSGCSNDFISIYSSKTGGEDWITLHEKLCVAPADTINSGLGNFLKITFTSDSSIRYRGFQSLISAECGGLLTDSSGIVDFKWDCWNEKQLWKDSEWKIKVRPGRTIRIIFEHFNITNHEDNCSNYLKLYNGESKESPILGNGKYCGYAHEDRIQPIITSSNHFYVVFHYQVYTFQNFKIRYEELNVECGGTSQLDIDHPWEIINSLNYPSVPIPYSECVWIFTAPPGEIVKIDFIDRFDLEFDADCEKEFIEIRDGITDYSPLRGRYCQSQPGSVKTTNNVMYVKYLTEIAEPRNGFKANVTIDICGGTIYDNEGEISSPGYPHMLHLPVGTICEWKLKSLGNSVFTIQPLEINLPETEHCATKIVIEEILAFNKTTYILKEICNSDYNTSINTFSNEVVIKLIIGPLEENLQISQYRGFKIKYFTSVSSCGETITGSEGFITTPGYPRLQSSIYCQWFISASNPSRRIKLEIIDADVNKDIHNMGIYNDHTFQSAIQIISSNKDEFPLKTVFQSSGSKMALYLIKKQRFKAKYTTDEPSLCGSPTLNDEINELFSPEINNTYFCEWHYTSNDKDYNTLSVNVKMNTSTPRSRCRFSDSKLNIKASVVSTISFTRDICSNNEETVRIPSNSVSFKAVQAKRSSISFSIKFKKQPCGGVVTVGESPTNLLIIPSTYNGSLDCAWMIRDTFGSRIELRIEGEFNLPCSDEFIKISDGWTQRSPLIGDYCKDKKPSASIITHFTSMYIEYHTNSYNNLSNLKVTAQTATSPCGGNLIHSHDNVFTSPNYPKRYSENQECSWEITTHLGSRITLDFIDRFVIEDKVNCTSDVVIIYDWNDDEYQEIGKVCGRNIPPSFNSTHNKMKVIFRTNSEINLDGFKAKWKSFCGGNLIAKTKEQFIYSPGFPNDYSASLDCTYEITAPNSRIIIDFLTFELEGSYPSCAYDNVSITVHNNYMSDTAIYCGKTSPPIKTSLDKIEITFKTDKYLQSNGFKMSYKLFICGTTVTEPTTLSSISNGDTYEDSLNCTWSIQAPRNKVVIIKISYIDLEDSTECYADYLAAYDGLLINPDKRLALLCGHINSTTILRSTGNTMLFQFKSDFSMGYTGFKAQVYFSYSDNIGCGGEVHMTSDKYVMKSPIISPNILYDCSWRIIAPPDKIIRAQFLSFHVAPCKGFNQTSLGLSNCNCDYVEIRDGINPNSLVIGKYCGHTFPPAVTSSSQFMNLRLYTDTEIESSGFEVTFTTLKSECGQRVFYLDHGTRNITSPKDLEGNIPRGLHCSYNLLYNLNTYNLVHIRIKKVDLLSGSGQNNECLNDKLVFTESNLEDNKTFGANLTISSRRDSFLNQPYGYLFTHNIKYPKKFTLSGFHENIDLYSHGNLKINLQTSPERINTKHAGFDIEITPVNWCSNTNYSQSQARIQNLYYTNTAPVDCNILISAPENHTISVYFFAVYSAMYSGEWNAEAYFEVRDGNRADSPILKRAGQSYDEVNPVFSTGRYLLLHNHRDKEDSVTFDLNYVITDKGRGCGGKLHNVVGIVTSPKYPDTYRKVDTCEWELETPEGSKLLLRFKFFDLGRSCDQNYVELVDRSGKVFSSYCEELPANFLSLDNYVKIVFKTTRNNAGTGWVAEYMAVD